MVDMAATAYLANRFGPEGELNPVMKFFLELGIAEFIAVKVLLSVVACFMFWYFFPLHERASRIAIVICFTVYALLALYYVFGMALLLL